MITLEQKWNWYCLRDCTSNEPEDCFGGDVIDDPDVIFALSLISISKIAQEYSGQRSSEGKTAERNIEMARLVILSKMAMTSDEYMKATDDLR